MVENKVVNIMLVICVAFCFSSYVRMPVTSRIESARSAVHYFLLDAGIHRHDESDEVFNSGRF
jgi:hypothetical protein